jgi:hypothetical protein
LCRVTVWECICSRLYIHNIPASSSVIFFVIPLSTGQRVCSFQLLNRSLHASSSRISDTVSSVLYNADSKGLRILAYFKKYQERNFRQQNQLSIVVSLFHLSNNVRPERYVILHNRTPETKECSCNKCYISAVFNVKFLLLTFLVLEVKYINIIFFSPWSESASELYRPSDRRLSAK